MSIVNPVLPNTSADIARIAFSLFVYVADIDRNITPQEVRRFQVLLNDTKWVNNYDLEAGLRDLKERYSTFWSNYEDGIFPTDAQAIAETLDRVQRYVGEERTKQLKGALGRFLSLLDRGSFGVNLGQKNNPARVQAKNELATILLRGALSPVSDPVDAVPLAGSAGVTLPSFSVSAKSSPLQPALVQPLLPTPSTPIFNEAAERIGLKQGTPWPELSPPTPLPAQEQARYEQPEAMPAKQPHLRLDECTNWAGRTKVYCVSVVAETHDTKTYNFVGDRGTVFHYRPGQAMMLEVTVDGVTLRRTYTISSSPSRPYVISITVKKMPMGRMSNWLFEKMVPGTECTVSGPFGKFGCHDHSDEKLLLMAAGSGVTPLMSMLRWLADLALGREVIFIYNVSTPADIIFHQELLHLSTRLGNCMRLVIVPSATSVGVPWHGNTGRLSEMLIMSHVPDLAERETFVCGPPGYMASARSILLSLGLPNERYHTETFGSAKAQAPAVVVPPSQSAVLPVVSTGTPFRQASTAVVVPQRTPSMPKAASQPALSATKHDATPSLLLNGTKNYAASPSAMAPVANATKPHVIIENTGGRFSVAGDQTILDAAEEAGIHLDHSCRSGNCGTCKMYRVYGDVQMEPGHCLTSVEVDAGYVLTCVARPTGSANITLKA